MITGIGHLAFRITDLDNALDFYCTKLGFREAFRLYREGDKKPWIVYIQVAPNQFIELFPDAEEIALQRSSAVGYNHFCLVVDDMQATLQELTDRGLQLKGEPTQGLDHNWQFWLTDPDGNRIELMQIMPESPQAQADRELLSQ